MSVEKQRTWLWVSLLVGEALYNACRKTLPLSMTAISEEMGLSKSQLGAMASFMSLSYTLSKPIVGVASDFVSNRKMFAFGLALTGAAQFGFGNGQSFGFFCLCQSLNGLFQGAGWPSAAKLLVVWFPVSVRATYWSIICAGTNLGGAVAPLFLVLLPWRTGFALLGLFTILASRFVFLGIRDKEGVAHSPAPGIKLSVLPSLDTAVDESEMGEKNGNAVSPLHYVRAALGNRMVLLSSLAAFCLYFVMQSVANWTLLFLVEEKNFTMLAATSSFLWYDVGGVVGSLLSGPIATHFRSRLWPCIVCAW